MAKTGLAYLFMAKYAASAGTVSYSDGMMVDHLIEADIQIQTSENNNLHGDNVVQETEKTFSNGTISLNTTDLTQAESAFILGLPSETPTITGVTETGLKKIHYNDSAQAPYLGLAFVPSGQKNNVPYSQVIMLNKTIFNIPNSSYKTRGEQIEWQTPTITGQIMRDDSSTHEWRNDTGNFSSEANAITAAKSYLNIT